MPQVSDLRLFGIVDIVTNPIAVVVVVTVVVIVVFVVQSTHYQLKVVWCYKMTFAVVENWF